MKKNLLKYYFENSAGVIRSLIDEEKKIELIIKNIRNCYNKKKSFDCWKWWIQFRCRSLCR